MNTDRRLAAAALAACMLLAACGNAASVVSPSTTSTTDHDNHVERTEHHSRPTGDHDGSWRVRRAIPPTGSIRSPNYEAYARRGAGGQSVVKFSIPDFFNSERVHWMDSNFYELHDEWYWFPPPQRPNDSGLDDDTGRRFEFHLDRRGLLLGW